jgi:thymidine kinase
MFELESIFDTSKSSVIRDLKKAVLIRENWEKIAGTVLADQLQVSFVKGDILNLETQNTCWISEIQFYEEELIKKVNSISARKGGIKKIKIKLQNSDKTSTNRFAKQRKGML